MGMGAVSWWSWWFSLLLPLMVIRQMVVEVSALGKEGLYFDFIDQTSHVLRLKCEVEVSSSYGEVVSITIYNVTSGKSKMAYVSTNNQPTSASAGPIKKSLYLSGGVSREKHKNPVLKLLLLQYVSYIDQTFVCDTTILKEGTDIETRTWNVTVNRTVETTLPPKTTTVTTTKRSSDNAAKIGAIQDGDESNSFLNTDSLPMTVLIVMLVLISIVLFIAIFLLMHRYRSRCVKRDEELYRPPAYCLAPDHHLDWSDNGSTLKSKGSARTLNSRSHYSFAAHNMPLPAIPTSATMGRRSRTSRRPPSVNSSVKVQYIQPQDAIGQESSEDGEIAALSSGSPTVHYKTSRDRERYSRQNSPLYACVPVSSTDE